VNLSRRHLLTLTAISLLALVLGCSDRNPTGLDTARANIDPLVFDDDYSEDVYFQAFSNTHYTAVAMDSVFAYEGFAPDGSRSLKINVPAIGSALGAYAGGVLTSSGSRDLADFNALTFYARASEDISMNEAGFGNDNTGNSLYGAGIAGVGLNSEWAFVIIPIPNSSKLIAERGLFTFAEGAQEEYPDGYDIWVDEIRYAKLGNIEVIRPTLPSPTVPEPYFIGSTVNISGTFTVFRIDGALKIVQHMPGYFDFANSNSSVAAVVGNEVQIIGEGTTTITASLEFTPGDTTEVIGAITVNGYEQPTVAAIPPTLPAEDVISMYSDVYNDVLVDTWRADWGGVTTQVTDVVIAGDNNKQYSSLNWVGIDFQTELIDASDMTHLHMDVYAPEGTSFNVKLVSYPDGSAGAQTQDLVMDDTTTPAFNKLTWCSLDIPLEDFDLPAEGWDWAYLGQMVLSSANTRLVLVDNIYFHQ